VNNPLINLIAILLATIVLVIAIVIETLLFVARIPKILFWYGRYRYLLSRREHGMRVARRMRSLTASLTEPPYSGLSVTLLMIIAVIFAIATIVVAVLQPFPRVEGSFTVRACISYVGHLVCLR
jgi:hypothetical protein